MTDCFHYLVLSILVYDSCDKKKHGHDVWINVYTVEWIQNLKALKGAQIKTLQYFFHRLLCGREKNLDSMRG